jgi:phage gpG-like protein
MGLLVSGLDSIDQLMDRAVIGARDSLEKSSSIVINGIKENFNTRGLHTQSEPWAKVPAPWLWKRKTWPGGIPLPMHWTQEQAEYARNHFPLVDTGKLRDSMIYSDAETAGGNIVGEVFPTVEYAVDQNNGVPGIIRQREFMKISSSDETDVVESVEKSMQGWLS